MRTSLSGLVYSMLTVVKGSMYMMSRMVLVCPLYFPDRPSDLRIHREGLSSPRLLTAIHRVTRHGLAKVDSRIEMNGVYGSDMRLFCSEHPAKPVHAVKGLIRLDWSHKLSLFKGHHSPDANRGHINDTKLCPVPNDPVK